MAEVKPKDEVIAGGGDDDEDEENQVEELKQEQKTSSCSRLARKTISRRHKSGSPNRRRPSARKTVGTHFCGQQVTVTKRWLGS